MTQRVKSRNPRVSQTRSCFRALRKTQAPRDWIRPISSARGMNSSGGTKRPGASDQRSSASRPARRPSRSSRMGW